MSDFRQVHADTIDLARKINRATAMLNPDRYGLHAIRDDLAKSYESLCMLMALEGIDNPNQDPPTQTRLGLEVTV